MSFWSASRWFCKESIWPTLGLDHTDLRPTPNFRSLDHMNLRIRPNFWGLDTNLNSRSSFRSWDNKTLRPTPIFRSLYHTSLRSRSNLRCLDHRDLRPSTNSRFSDQTNLRSTPIFRSMDLRNLRWRLRFSSLDHSDLSTGDQPDYFLSSAKAYWKMCGKHQKKMQRWCFQLLAPHWLIPKFIEQQNISWAEWDPQGSSKSSLCFKCQFEITRENVTRFTP